MNTALSDCWGFTLPLLSLKMERDATEPRTLLNCHLPASSYKQNACFMYITYVIVWDRTFSLFSFIVDTIVKRYSTLAVLPKKLRAFIAGIIRARARIADATTRFAFRTRLMAIITRRCLLRTVSISRGGPRVHSTYCWLTRSRAKTQPSSFQSIMSPANSGEKPEAGAVTHGTSRTWATLTLVQLLRRERTISPLPSWDPRLTSTVHSKFV